MNPRKRRIAIAIACTLAAIAVVVVVVLVCEALAPVPPLPPGAPGKRVIHFPKDRSLGTLYTRSWGAIDDNNRELAGAARGRVGIPAVKEIAVDAFLRWPNASLTILHAPAIVKLKTYQTL